ncbi:MAG TPA: RHS repeat-associated core domain-containing protein, partial [Fimbriimonadaceae bacterium]|nr:RHS repeat-associated core domain-containing protein [Fimbriimonadaceae bacterium]
VTDTYAYTAFGVPTSTTGSSVNPFRYVGQYGYYDDGSRGAVAPLLLLGVRYYSAVFGRFGTWDPIQDHANLYEYAANFPTVCVDPRGTIVVGIVIIGGLLIIGGCGRPRPRPRPLPWCKEKDASGDRTECGQMCDAVRDRNLHGDYRADCMTCCREMLRGLLARRCESACTWGGTFYVAPCRCRP